MALIEFSIGGVIMSKAQNISINVIVVAVIALLVLVVLMAIFGGRMGIWSEKTEDLENQKCKEQATNAKVVPYEEDCGESFSTSMGGYSDVPSGYKCCLPDQVAGQG